MLRITSAEKWLSDAELLTKYLYKLNFAGYYSRNIHSIKHMVPSKVMFLLPRNAGLITIGSWVYRIPWLETEQCFYTESSAWSYKEMGKTPRLILGMELNLPRLYQAILSEAGGIVTHLKTTVNPTSSGKTKE